MGENPFVSVVIPVKNEAGILRDCLESLSRLDYPKERLEIILADGRSTDNTKEIGLAYGVKIVTNAKGIVSSGRNRGFEEAKGELIAFTDADCIFDVSWLKNSPKYFSDEKVAGIGGMTFAPRESSNFEKAIDFIFRLAELFQVTSHRRGSPIAKEVKDIPGCNAIYRKEALAKIMPIDEGLLTAEDVWMNFSLRKSGYRFISAPDVILWHHRRSSPKKFIRQIYRFAIGRLQAGKKDSSLINIFHIFAGFGIPLIFLAFTGFYFLGATYILCKIILCLFSALIALSLIKTRSWITAADTPLAVIIFIASWSGGFLRELLFPLRDPAGK